MTATEPPTLPYDVVVNPVTGERIEFTQPPDERDGRRLDFAFTVDPGGGVPTAHRHRHQSETMTCVAGELVVTVAGTDHVLREGDTLVIPANTTHTILNQGTEPATCRVTYEPAGRNEDWFRLIHGFAYVHGREPGLLDMAPFLPDVDILVPQPPEAIQRFTVKWVMRPLGLLLGRRRRMLATAAQAYGRPVTW